MKTSDKTLMEQLRLTSREIKRRKKYFAISDHDSELLRSMKQRVGEELDEIIDEFYKILLAFDEMDQIIGDSETLIRLRNHFKSYILTIFDGQFDEEYVHSRLRVGVVHRRIGVKPKYYVSAIHRISSILKKTILKEKRPFEECCTLIEAIEKILMFDLSLTFDTYIHSLMDESRRSRTQLEEYAESLEETVAERTRLLKMQARNDGLTGLLNQRAFYTELRKELSRGQRQNYAITLIYFDIDGFKNINDTKGHRAGDEILIKVAEATRQTIREGELIARYGGDEFCIILPNSSLEEGRVLSERLCETIKKSVNSAKISCSIGISSSTPDNYHDADSLVRLADQAMYAAKKKTGYVIETISS